MRLKEIVPILASILLVMVLALLMGLQPQPYPFANALHTLQTPVSNLKPKQVDQKIQAIRDLITWQPWRNELWETLGDVEFDAGHEDQAAAAYEQAARVAALSMQGKIRLGDLYYQLDRREEAVKIWQGVLASSNLAEEAAQRLVRVQRQSGDFEGAGSSLQQGLASNPNNPSMAFELGLILLGEKPEEAITWMEKASQVDPSLGSQVLPFKEAVRKVSQSRAPGAREMILGRVLAGHGDWDLALQLFKKATSLQPENADAWGFLAEARQQTGGEGQADLQKAQQLNPQSVLVQVLTALYYRRQGKPDLAVPFLVAASQAEPQQAMWKLELGNTYAQLGELDKALSAFQDAARLDPGNPFYWRTLARFSVSNDVEPRQTGLPAARQALLLAPDDARNQDVMGWVFYNLGDFDSAERFLQRAVSIDSSLAEGYLHLGQLYIQMGNYEKAFISLSTARRLAGEQTEVGQVASRLIGQYFSRGS